jgi:hypothetical protein
VFKANAQAEVLTVADAHFEHKLHRGGNFMLESPKKFENMK